MSQPFQTFQLKGKSTITKKRAINSTIPKLQAQTIIIYDFLLMIPYHLIFLYKPNQKKLNIKNLLYVKHLIEFVFPIKILFYK
jgi:hypothetical protein